MTAVSTQAEGLPAPDDPQLALVMRTNLVLSSISELLVEHWRAHARAKDLTGGQAKVLLALTAGTPIAMRHLARSLASDASNLTSVIDRLEDRGLVVRGYDTSDRRRRPVTLTRVGQNVRDAFWRDLTHDPGPLASLSSAQLKSLCRWLAPAAGAA